jgi:hypothetical protein
MRAKLDYIKILGTSSYTGSMEYTRPNIIVERWIKEWLE